MTAKMSFDSKLTAKTFKTIRFNKGQQGIPKIAQYGTIRADRE